MNEADGAYIKARDGEIIVLNERGGWCPYYTVAIRVANGGGQGTLSSIVSLYLSLSLSFVYKCYSFVFEMNLDSNGSMAKNIGHWI